MYPVRKAIYKDDFHIFIFLLKSIWRTHNFAHTSFETKFKVVRKTNSLFFIPKNYFFNVKKRFFSELNRKYYRIVFKCALTSSQLYN